MTPFTLDPLGMALLRRLSEAEEAVQIARAAYEASKNELLCYARGLNAFSLAVDYEALLADFLEHLDYMPCPEIEAAHYHQLWHFMQTLPGDERNMGRLFDVAQDIGQKAIEQYREESEK